MAATRDGGKPNVKPLPYSPPQGPTNQMHEGPGLGGQNCGNTQKPMASQTSGSPGLHGRNKGNDGSQR